MLPLVFSKYTICMSCITYKINTVYISDTILMVPNVLCSVLLAQFALLFVLLFISSLWSLPTKSSISSFAPVFKLCMYLSTCLQVNSYDSLEMWLGGLVKIISNDDDITHLNLNPGLNYQSLKAQINWSKFTVTDV